MHDFLTLVSLYNAGKADSSISGAEKSKRIIKTRSRSDCVHEQVAKLGPVSRAAGMDCECPLYSVNYSVGSFLQFCKNNQQEFPIPGK